MADQNDATSGGAPGTPAGWYPDPKGRYEQRYHDGSDWTEHVSTAGTAGTDDPTAGPAGPGFGGAPTGASLYGAPSAPYAPAAAGHFSATPQVPGYRPQRMSKNRIGAGLFVAIGGWLIIGAALFLPWFGDANIFQLPEAREVVQSTYEGYSTYSADYAPLLALQVIFTMLWMVLAIICTTLPLQPGKILGFFFGGCIGLIVCWRPVGPHDRTMRANILGVILVIGALIRLWFALELVRGAIEPEYADLGTGPYVAALGYLVVAIGMILGRRRVLTDI